tara:strand:+ start:670 stop:951 length:282 start_codon:yes stop_codon:yes gene_type:complete
MKMMDWRADPTLTSEAERVLKNKTVRAMLEVLTDERPSTRPLPPVGAQGTDHAYANGLESGWRAAVETMKMLAVPLPTNEEMVATFEDSNKDD